MDIGEVLMMNFCTIDIDSTIIPVIDDICFDDWNFWTNYIVIVCNCCVFKSTKIDI